MPFSARRFPRGRDRRDVAEDALVNDAHREFWDAAAIRRWVANEMVGDRVTLEVTEVIRHHGQTILRGRHDGESDKTNLPDEPILTNYFTVRDESTPDPARHKFHLRDVRFTT